MRVLVYHGKHGCKMWDASTPEREDAALRDLFLELDEGPDAYRDLQKRGANKIHLDLLRGARKGKLEAIRLLLRARSLGRYEYETWGIDFCAVGLAGLVSPGRETEMNFARRGVIERTILTLETLLADGSVVLGRQQGYVKRRLEDLRRVLKGDI